MGNWRASVVIDFKDTCGNSPGERRRMSLGENLAAKISETIRILALRVGARPSVGSAFQIASQANHALAADPSADARKNGDE